MVSADAALVLAHVEKLGLQPSDQRRGWQHMGAVVADAALQAGIRYQSVVLPRVRHLVEQWPEATTTAAFVRRLESEDIAAALNWKPGGKKLVTLRSLAHFLADHDVQTPDQLRERLADPGFRAELRRRVPGVGPKTVDYLSILCGAVDRSAIDVHMRAFARDAGVTTTSYDDVHALIAEAAAARGWSTGSLDAVIWAHQSKKKA